MFQSEIASWSWHSETYPHYLDVELYEHDFGIRVTLNCVDPIQIRSTDSLDPGVGRRRRVQMPIGSDLTLLDFDQDSSILGRLTGKVLDKYKNLFRDATGAASLRVNLELKPDELVGLCKSLLKLYESTDYEKTFPSIQNVSPVRDPTLLDGLNGLLTTAIQEKEDGLFLAVPDILNYEEGIFCSFRGAGKSDLYGDVLIDHYYDYLEAAGVDLATIDIDSLKRHKLLLADDDGNQKGPAHSIFKSLIFDTKLNGDTFHLLNGSWYRVEPSYVATLTSDLDPHWANLDLPQYDHPSEGAYNSDCPDQDNTLLCLDKTNIGPDGQSPVEPCDLFRVEGPSAVFYHVKVSTLSAALSHHFNQGANALELLLLEPAALKKLKSLLKAKLGAQEYGEAIKPLDEQNHKVAFAIVTHKDIAKKSSNLPLFSRISLRRVIRALRVAKTDVAFGFVPDKRTPQGKKKKPRKGKQT